MRAPLLFFALFLPGLLAADPVDFDRDIRPIFSERCLQCHGGVKKRANLTFVSRDAALTAAKSGKPAIDPGHPEKSELFRRVTSADPEERMPPEGAPLNPDQIAKLRAWIAEGAAWPMHWAFQPLRVSTPPRVQNSAWVRNPIDQFILAKLEASQLTPSPPAAPNILIRRAYLDLLGLPAPIEALDAFENDPSPDAYQRLVDRLLESPHFGERWGRHWLDQARYADSDGYEKDNARPDAWKWRAWVIDALNADLPFDQFTREQMAGDILPEATPEQKLGTAFHLQTLFNREGGVDPEEDRVKRVIDRVNTTATVWLGLTIGCSQCHDHPYDPLAQTDFYRLFAFFNNADESTVDMAGSAPVPRQTTNQVLAVRVLAQRHEALRPTYLFHRGDFLQPDISSGTLEPSTPHALPKCDEPSPRDRVALAKWLAQSPLSARVRVNKVWATLFAQGLVGTLDDFGMRGERPTHPELLDWLAHRFHENGRLKDLIRLIVTSTTYRQSSNHRPELVEKDPDNQLFHRQNRLRVEAEIIRDLHLAVGGLLEHRIGSPSVFPPLAPDVAALSYADNFKWETSAKEDRYRRGMYTFFKRTAPDPNLMVFDCPDANVTATGRNRSNTPIQALTSLQNEVYVEAARALGRRVLRMEMTSDTQRLTHAWRLCLARIPEARELAPMLELLESSRHYYRAHPDDAAQLSCDNSEHAAWVATLRVLLNLDEFITRG